MGRIANRLSVTQVDSGSPSWTRTSDPMINSRLLALLNHLFFLTFLFSGRLWVAYRTKLP